MSIINDNTQTDAHLTPREAIQKYPDLIKKFNWTTSDLGDMLKCKIIDGYYDRGRRNSMIRESSLKRLMIFVNANLDLQKVGTI